MHISVKMLERANAFNHLLAFVLCLCSLQGKGQAKEPYLPLHGGEFKQKSVRNSPDPIINYQWKSPGADDSLQIYTLFPRQITPGPSNAFQIADSNITVSGTGDLQFDFGQVNAGWIEFDSEDLNGDVQVSISEYNEPAILNAGAQHPVKTLKPLRYGNTYRLELNQQLYEGVRFAWLHVKTFSKPWKLTNFRLVCQIKPVNYLGSFSCNDTLLNRIWYTGAYTVKLNLLQDYLGAILMERSDRHSWTGDAYPSQAASLAAFGNFDFVKKNIAFTAPQDNGIAAYSMYWVLGLVDYFRYTGDTELLKAYLDNAARRLDAAYAHFDQLPDLAFMGWDERLGAGFERPNLPESQRAYRWLCINAWSKFAECLSVIGNKALSDKYRRYAEAKKKQLSGEQLSGYGVHALAEVFNAGNDSTAAAMQLALKWFKDRNARLSYSPFNQYFILQGMGKAGYQEEALTTVRDQWGGQLMYGGTTFFEVFRPSWNTALAPNSAPVNNQCGYTSLTHPWGAGVTRWLSDEILGVRPLSPGFKTFSIIPFLNKSLTWVKGDVPTPSGVISASFNSKTGDCEVHIPTGTTATKVGLPKNGRSVKKVTVNSSPVKIAGEDAQYAYLLDLSPGDYRIRIHYGKPTPGVTDTDKSKLEYALTALAADSTSGPDRQSRLGKDGRFLAGRSMSENILEKPAYIDSLRIDRAVNQTWKTTSAFVTQDPKPTLQTFTLDIFQSDPRPYDLTLYFVDPDRKQRRSAIEVFDAHTLELLSPVQVIDHYQNGKYLRLKVDRSVRVRINHVRGPNAALAGIFFD
ncbi:alpha-L-rhamnosidase C-terminal domain-containing protein [Dyadobacter bucti]|uniref:alpha-L-rhamnosidase C-terminal domain-containing protein n=1 Tax=Dyadobacter bucti TaxID=2572203 RepID=UPI0011098C96|nr:alpha-L-rhamnosidase C-terminal domain-containing protein [Dyadobacter bucti]